MAAGAGPRSTAFAGALAVAVAMVLAACGARTAAVTLPAGSRVLARGSLAYAVGFADGDRVVSIELEERFALVVRSADGRGLGRFDLGPAERDLGALAIGGDIAWLGGADRRVRGVALADGHVVATWPTGAIVTALIAAPGGWLLIGDADGALCLRRLGDGALLQCVQLDGPVTALAWQDGRAVATAGTRRRGVAVPTLAFIDAPADPHRLVPVGRELRQGGAVVLHLGGVVRAVAVDEQGRIAVAGWIARLDDPSVVLLPTRSR